MNVIALVCLTVKRSALKCIDLLLKSGAKVNATDLLDTRVMVLVEYVECCRI